MAKLNFYSFVERILRFIAIANKMLIPVRQAFMKIDSYASFAFRLEESLKVVPHRYLLDSFNQIKLSVRQAEERKDIGLKQEEAL